MASESDIQFSLDLDSEGFKKGLEGAFLSLEELKKRSVAVEGAFNWIGSLTVDLGILYGSFKLLQGAVEVVFDAERIKSVNAQFEMLTANAGISGGTLRAELEKASGGLTDMTSLLKVANESIVMMGHKAEDLAQILELARKYTITFGGDLTSNFERMSQAMAMGNERMLKKMGITVDLDKALRDYALTVGRSVSELNPAQIAQAKLNGALEAGSKQFKAVNGSALEATSAWARFKASLTEVSESMILFIDQTIGPFVKRGLNVLATAFKDLAGVMKAHWGSASDQAEAKLKSLDVKIEQHNKNIERMQWLLANGAAFKSPEKQAILKKQIEEEQAQIEGLTKALEIQAEKKREIEAKTPKVAVTESPPDLKYAEKMMEVNVQTIRDQEKLIELKQKTAIDDEEFGKLEQQRAALRQEALGREIVAIKLKGQIGQLDAQETQNKITEAVTAAEQQRFESERSFHEKKLQFYNEQLSNAKTAADGIGAAFRRNAEEATKGMTNWGRFSSNAVNSFQTRSKNAFAEFGAGSKTASEAAKGFFFNMLGDVATAQGEFMMLDAFKTFPAVNVPEFAAGAALVALGGALGAAGGAKTGGASAAGGGGSVGGAEAYGSSPSIAANQPTQKSVTIAIQGNYFDTDQTRTRLLEMVREATDATDFKYVQIGQR